METKSVNEICYELGSLACSLDLTSGCWEHSELFGIRDQFLDIYKKFARFAVHLKIKCPENYTENVPVQKHIDNVRNEIEEKFSKNFSSYFELGFSMNQGSILCCTGHGEQFKKMNFLLIKDKLYLLGISVNYISEIESLIDAQINNPIDDFKKVWHRLEEKLKTQLFAKNTVEHENESLQARLGFFEKHGIPPKEHAFQQFLTYSKRLFKSKGLRSPNCFISYAWEDDSTLAGKEANEQMQHWIERLATDLRKLGLTVFFDLDNMHGSLRAAMRDNIARSDYFLLICTPRLMKRIDVGMTPTLQACIDSCRFAELQTGLQKLRDNAPDKADYDPKNNATFEFIHILAKIQQKTDALIPLHYSGSFNEAIPSIVRGDLVRNVQGIQNNEDKHYNLLADLSAPLGIIPVIYQLRNKDCEACLKEYEPLVEGFKNNCTKIDLEFQIAQQQTRSMANTNIASSSTATTNYQQTLFKPPATAIPTVQQKQHEEVGEKNPPPSRMCNIL
jgi:TIR domain